MRTLLYLAAVFASAVLQCQANGPSSKFETDDPTMGEDEKKMMLWCWTEFGFHHGYGWSGWPCHDLEFFVGRKRYDSRDDCYKSCHDHAVAAIKRGARSYMCEVVAGQKSDRYCWAGWEKPPDQGGGT